MAMNVDGGRICDNSSETAVMNFGKQLPVQNATRKLPEEPVLGASAGRQ
jgi:hypothetical protein